MSLCRSSPAGSRASKYLVRIWDGSIMVGGGGGGPMNMGQQVCHHVSGGQHACEHVWPLLLGYSGHVGSAITSGLTTHAQTQKFVTQTHNHKATNKKSNTDDRCSKVRRIKQEEKKRSKDDKKRRRDEEKKGRREEEKKRREE